MKPNVLGQIFYGRGPDGYGVLGTSPAGRPFLGAVASLCRAVGSPDRPGEIPTFLLGKREGDAAIMIRACRGAADPTGRATVFFHALVADAASLRSAGLDAFALADAGVFAGSCPGREPSDLSFPKSAKQDAAPAGSRSIDLPATISSDQPLDALVRRELGVKSLDLNWATFTFNPLPDFDLCVLSSYSPRKGAGTLYAYDGAGVHRLSPKPASLRPSGGGVLPAGQSPAKKSSLPLFLSLAANVALVLALLLRGGKDNTVPPGEKPIAVEMSESDARAKWEAQWKSEWEQSLPPQKPDMTEAEAKAKWESQWQDNWKKTLRRDFEELLHSSGLTSASGDWPIPFAIEYTPFLSSIRKAEREPSEKPAAQQWRIYRACKACSEFIQTHLTPNP